PAGPRRSAPGDADHLRRAVGGRRGRPSSDGVRSSIVHREDATVQRAAPGHRRGACRRGAESTAPRRDGADPGPGGHRPEDGRGAVVPEPGAPETRPRAGARPPVEHGSGSSRDVRDGDWVPGSRPSPLGGAGSLDLRVFQHPRRRHRADRLPPTRPPWRERRDADRMARPNVRRAHGAAPFQRREERFLLLGRATNDVVWDWDLQTDGMWMNDNLAAMFGYRAEDVEPTGTWWEERLHPDDRGRVGASVDDLIGTGGSVWSAEYRFRRQDGTYATVVDRGYVLHDASGHPVRMIGSVMDVSKQRKAEAIQSAVYKISEAANAARDLPELYRHIHEVVGGLMPATNFYIALYDDRAQTLSFPYFVDEEESPPPPQKLGRGLTEYVLRSGRPLLASPTVF